MTLNAQEMLVLQALEMGHDLAVAELGNTIQSYAAYPGHRKIAQAERDVRQIETCIDIVKGWGNGTT